MCDSLCFWTVKREEISDTLTIHVGRDIHSGLHQHRDTDYKHTLKALMRRSRVFEVFCALVCFLCSRDVVVKKGNLGAGLWTDWQQAISLLRCTVDSFFDCWLIMSDSYRSLDWSGPQIAFIHLMGPLLSMNLFIQRRLKELHTEPIPR